MNGRYGRALTVIVTVGSGLAAGVFVVTFAYHIPKNDDLALVDPNSAGAASAWNDYQTPWTAWNYVRTLAFLAAAILFAVALLACRRSEATSKTTRPAGKLASAAELAGSGVPR
jgi:uncharacterized membrane protein